MHKIRVIEISRLLITDNAITIARRGADPFEVDDLNAAPGITDGPRSLNRVRDHSNARSLNTEHVREKFLSQF